MQQTEPLQTLQLYTPQEIARMLKVSPDTVYKWCKRGSLSYHKWDGEKGSIRLTMEDVKNFVRVRRIESRNRPQVDTTEAEKKE